MARVRRSAAGPPALLHRAGRRPFDPRPRHRGLAGGPARERTDLRLDRRPDGPGAVDGHRARRDRDLRGLAAGPDDAARVRRCSALGPGSVLRSTTRRPAATSPTRPRRASEARRSACTARRRWAVCSSARPSARSGADRLRRDRASCSSSARSPRSPRPCWSRCACARRRTGRTRRLHPTPPSSRPTPRRSPGARRPTSMPSGPVHADPTAPTLALEPRPDRGDRHQRRRLLRGRHVRGHLEPVPGGPRRGPRVHRASRSRCSGCRCCSSRRIAGRLVDRRGSFAFIVIGSILPAVTGILYTRLADPGPAVLLILIEATGFAFLNPALYAVVAANSPAGRSSTAQGLLRGGGHARVHRRVARRGRPRGAGHPAAVLRLLGGRWSSSLVVGLLIGGPRLRGRRPAPVPRPARESAPPDADAFDRMGIDDYHPRAGWSSGSSSGS